MIKFAVIGTSPITKQLISAIELCPEAELYAVYSRSMEKAESFGKPLGAARFYDSLEDMAKDEMIDAIYVASPNSLHYSQAMMMLAAGKHVLCEKSLAATREQAFLMFQAAKEKKVVLMEAMRSVHEPGMAVLKEQLSKIGPIRNITLPFAKYSSKYDSFLAGKEENIFNPALAAGALMDIGVYCVHLLVHLFGMPQQVQCASVSLRNGADGAGTILASYEDKVAELPYSKISTNVLPAQIQGEKGTILVFDPTEISRVEVLYFDGRKREVIPIEKTTGNKMIYELEAFVGFLAERTGLETFQASSLMALEVMESARKSSEK